jgi:formylglycine-generating enzyme required for sulfatase activity
MSDLAASTVRDMVHIPGRSFRMGSDHHYPEESPAHVVAVDGFLIDRYAVTNSDFARFVQHSGYVTLAERPPDPAQYRGARPDLLVPASAVFVPPPHRVELHDPYQWWTYVPGADWRHPQGPGSTVAGRPDHPVVHVAWEDVLAYAAWAGVQLPTEAEWELAARGGIDGAPYAWGEEFNPDGRHLANTWQGEFPIENTAADGHEGTAPVGRYPPNGYGLYDMIGNVWEWTADWYAEHSATAHACCADSHDPAAPGVRMPRKVVKGGSYLCAPNYCRRYRPAARTPQAVDTSTSHLGFRCVVRPGPPPPE